MQSYIFQSDLGTELVGRISGHPTRGCWGAFAKVDCYTSLVAFPPAPRLLTIQDMFTSSTLVGARVFGQLSMAAVGQLSSRVQIPIAQEATLTRLHSMTAQVTTRRLAVHLQCHILRFCRS